MTKYMNDVHASSFCSVMPLSAALSPKTSSSGCAERKVVPEDGSMTMDFVGYWHTPAKHVPYTGTKL